ncbi:hypothetical protein CAEBREN_32719 [Caenorhabditis brenneri]|uniref:PDZ domain-containing protein n=1 Tax=Caenorhabditis brenneri TaxID=135651 RepID=G0NY20_CAEBE|nr:hypothetical protein CAEBREN_32719 [Caenorhabditis brenneri]
MVSLRGAKKENKQSKNEVSKKLPSSDAPSKLSRSPVLKKNRASREKIQQSSEQRSFDVIEVNEDEDANKVFTPDPSPINSPNVSVIPSTHFVPVNISFELENVKQFLFGVTINKNLVVSTVKREWMTCFMPGDQVSSFNLISIWNRSQLDRELSNVVKNESQKCKLSFVVIRAWNMSCITRSQMDRLGILIDDRLHYFTVRVYCNNRAAGLYLRSEKKRMLVTHIRAKTSISFSLLIGDQILGINDEILAGKSSKAIYKQAKDLMLRARKLEFIEILACRPISVRSSPTPSVDAELAMKLAKTAAEQPSKPDKKSNDDASTQPLAADALEISFRELTVLQQSIKIDLPLPTCDKGAPLLRPSINSADQSNTVSCASEKSEYTPTNNTTGSMMVSAISETPRKRGMIFKKRSQQIASISFTEQPETSKVTSDISEEAELKKCDPRSGIVSYIKNVFNN